MLYSYTVGWKRVFAVEGLYRHDALMFLEFLLHSYSAVV